MHMPPNPGAMPTCDTAGVFGPAVSVVASCQASDAVKILLGRGDLVSRTLLSFDLWSNDRRRIDLSALAGESCPCCVERRFEFLAGEGAPVIERLCGQNATQVRPGGTAKIDMASLAERLRRVGTVTANKFLIRCALPHEHGDNGEAIEFTVFADGRALVKGLAEPAAAKSLYARYIGG
jgi:adenylyltransferase/sulfurtransferase